MVVETSHSEYMANRLPNENHLAKIKQYADNSRESAVKNGVKSDGLGDMWIAKNKDNNDTLVEGKTSSFTKKKFEIVKHDRSVTSAGLTKLKEMIKSNSTNGICNSNDFDYLLWKEEPKELALSINFAQMLNFMNISGFLSVEIITILETDDTSSKTCRFSRELDYSIFRPEVAVISMIPSALNKEGPKGDMVKLINQNNHAIGLSESIASKAVGVEMGLMSGRSATKMNAIRNKPIDMRQMALKAVMIKLQLSLIYALDENDVEVETTAINIEVKPSTTTEALKHFPSKDVIIDIANLSDTQKNILAVLCSKWPSQRLVHELGCDIYSALSIEAENYQLYTSHNDMETIQVNGLLMHPKTFWAQCVQLFMNLGGLDDLVEVVRDSRGLAPIMVYNCKAYGRAISVVSAYPMSTCYHGLDVKSVPNRKYVAPTILESSTLVLLVDNMMLTLYLNNLLYMTENLGLGSRTLFPNVEGDANNKAMDILACYNLTSGLPSCELMDLACPWLSRMGRFQNGGVSALMDMVNRVRNRQEHGLVCCSLNYRIPTKMRVSSSALVRGCQEIDVSKIMGFHSTTDVTGPTIQMVNWYNAISGDALPCFGPSAHGSKLRGDELPMLRKIHKYKGVYHVARVIAITEYAPQKTGESTLRQTFFQNPGYMEAEGVVKTDAKPIEYKANSFSLAGVASASKLGKVLPNEELEKTVERFSTLAEMIKEVQASTNDNLGSSAEETLNFINFLDRLSSSYGLTPGGLHGKMKTDEKMRNEVMKAMLLERLDRTKTPRSSTGSSDSDTTLLHPGVCKLLEIPESEPYDVVSKVKSGNCAIEALGASLPNLDLAEGLGKMGVTLDDGFWLAADELAKIADHYNKNLLVMKDKGPVEYYCRDGQENRGVVIVHQNDNHFRPGRSKGTTVSQQVLKIAVEPVPCTENGRILARKAIEKGQLGRHDKPRTQ